MVITDVNQVVYQGDGATTAFPFTFRIIDATDIKLLLIDADGAEIDITSDFFVDTVNNTVHYPGYAPGAEPPEADRPAPVQTGQRMVVYRELPVTQEKDLGDKWPFFVIELALDKLTMLIQQVKGIWDRCLKVSVGQEATAPDFDYTVPIEAGKTFRVNDDGTGFEVTEDPKVAMEAAEAAQEAAERAQGAAEDARNDAEAAAENAEAALDLIKEKATWFDNVATMKAAAGLQVGMLAGTKGYYSINDGGSSIYAIRAKTQDDVDDGGIIIVLDNGNVAELITDDAVSVKQFGAIGDGVTDDSSAFRNAFLMPKLYIPAGNYKLTAPVFGLNEVICNGTFTDMAPFFKTPHFLDTLQAIGKVHEFSPADARSMYAECMTYDTKREKIIISFYWFDSPKKNVFLVLNKDTYAIEQTIDAPYTYPFNALSYNAQNDTIYASGSNTAYIFDAGDLTSYTTFTIPDGKSHIAHDNLTNTDLVVSRSDGRITIDVYLNGDYSTKLHTVTSNAGIVEDTAWQDVCAHDGKVYCCSWTGLYEVDVATGDVYKLAISTEHEIEGFTFIDGAFYIIAHVANSGWTESIYTYNPSVKPKPSNEFYNDAVSLSLDVNLYDFLATGKYYVSTTDPTTNDYPNGETKGYLVVLNSFTQVDTYVARQIFYSTTAPYEIYCREFTRRGTAWTAWKKLSSFNREIGSVIKTGTITTATTIENIDVSAYKTVMLTIAGNYINKQSYLIPVNSNFWFSCNLYGSSAINAHINGHFMTSEKRLEFNKVELTTWTNVEYEIRGVEKA